MQRNLEAVPPFAKPEQQTIFVFSLPAVAVERAGRKRLITTGTNKGARASHPQEQLKT
jgi:hypothetical protein